MANTDGTSWDETVPVGGSNVSNGDTEILSLRQGTKVRGDKQHVGYATSSVGGEHLEGSARCHIDTSNPTLQVIAAAGGDVTIASDAAKAKGAIYAKSNSGYILSVYNGGWQSVGYTQFQVGSQGITDTTSGILFAITGSAASKGIEISNASSGGAVGIDLSTSNAAAKGMEITITTGQGIFITNNSTLNGIFVDNKSTGDGIEVDNDSTGKGINVTNDSTGKGIEIVNASTGIGQYINNAAAGNGIDMDNASTGNAIYVDNNSTGKGVHISNNSTGQGLYLDSVANGPHMHIATSAVVASPANGNFWLEGTELKFMIGGTVYNLDKTAE